MTDKEKIRAFVEGRRKENWEKRYNNSGGDLFWDRANEDDEILSFIDSLSKPKFKVGDRIRKISIGDITGLKIKSICSDHFLCEFNIPVYFTELEDWELVEEYKMPVWRRAFETRSESAEENPKDIWFIDKAEQFLINIPKGSFTARCLMLEDLKSLPKEQGL